jgi:hypothetical protein
MNNTGWIKIYRSLLYWEWADVPEMVALWVRLIIRATHEDTQWHGVTISRGQLVTTTAKLAAESGLSPQQVRTCLDRLKASNQINTQTTNKYTIITICKYEAYQETETTEQQTNGKQTTRKQQTNNKQATSISRIKEQEELINKPPTPLQGDAPEQPEKPIVEQPAKPAREKAHAVTRYDRVWEEIYTKLTANTFFWTKRENVAVQSIVGRITKMMEEAGRDPTDTEKENALRWFVESLWQLDDQWIRTNFVPHVIDGKFNEYYNQLKQAKNGKPKHNTAGNPTGVSADYLARIAADLGGHVPQG